MKQRDVEKRVIHLLRTLDVPYKKVEVIDLRPLRQRYVVRVFTLMNNNKKKEQTERVMEEKLPENVSLFVY